MLSTAHRIRIRFERGSGSSLDPALISTINAHVDVLGLDKRDSKTITIDGVTRDVHGIGDPQAMRIYLLLLGLGRRADEPTRS